MAKRTATPRRQIDASSVEIRTYEGLNTGDKYLLIKGHLAGRDYFNCFSAHELKGASLDILGVPDIPTNRKVHAHKRAREIWYGKRTKALAASTGSGQTK